VTDPDPSGIARERLVHIDQMLAKIEREFAERDRQRQEIALAPRQVTAAVITVMATAATAAAGLLGAGIAIGKWL
jgi:hypothetical protein